MRDPELERELARQRRRRVGIIVTVAAVWLLSLASAASQLAARPGGPRWFGPECPFVDEGQLFEPTAPEAPCDSPVAVPTPTLGPPTAGTWRARHPLPIQSATRFAPRATRARARIARGGALVLQPLVLEPSRDQGQTDLPRVAAFLAEYLGVRVKLAPPAVLPEPPDYATRTHEGRRQLNIAWVLYHLRICHAPEDIGTLGVIGTDLWAGGTSRFAVGLASDHRGIGVVSLARMGEGRVTDTQRTRRSLGVIAHEAAHLLGLSHCAEVACNMNGASTMAEQDATPLTLCQRHLDRLASVAALNPKRRAEALSRAARGLGLLPESRAWRAQTR